MVGCVRAGSGNIVLDSSNKSFRRNVRTLEEHEVPDEVADFEEAEDFRGND